MASLAGISGMVDNALFASQEPALPKSKSKDPSSVDRAAQEFESMFISQMLQHMFADVNFGNDLEGDSQSQEVYRSMMVDEYGRLIARAGGIGVADYVKRELLLQQEVSAPAQLKKGGV